MNTVTSSEHMVTAKKLQKSRAWSIHIPSRHYLTFLRIWEKEHIISWSSLPTYLTRVVAIVLFWFCFSAIFHLFLVDELNMTGCMFFPPLSVIVVLRDQEMRITKWTTWPHYKNPPLFAMSRWDEKYVQNRCTTSPYLRDIVSRLESVGCVLVYLR